jgi:hypothetical protein
VIGDRLHQLGGGGGLGHLRQRLDQLLLGAVKILELFYE